jgi:hypothetical protein
MKNTILLLLLAVFSPARIPAQDRPPVRVNISAESQKKLVDARQAVVDAFNGGEHKPNFRETENRFYQVCADVLKTEKLVDGADHYYVCHLGRSGVVLEFFGKKPKDARP